MTGKRESGGIVTLFLSAGSAPEWHQDVTKTLDSFTVSFCLYVFI